MKKFSLLLLLSTLMACGTDSVIDLTSAAKISTIERRDFSGPDRLFYYDAEGMLQREGSTASNGWSYELAYENEQLIRVSLYSSTGELHSVATIDYHPSGTIRSIDRDLYAGEPEVRSTKHYRYTYNARNRVRERHVSYSSDPEAVSVVRYHWRGGNIYKEAYFDENGERTQEFFYTYDGQNNYQLGLPTSIYDPLLWGKENIVEKSYTDYTGLFDSNCLPCRTRYEYNSDGYPVEVFPSVGDNLIITYQP